MSDEISPAILATLERLAELHFELVPMPELTTHYVIARGAFVSMVDRREDGSFGSSGNPGKIGERGLALFVRRGERAVFASKGHEEEASQEEAEAARVFAAELKQALSG
ncbi:MAG: hypothetical protein KJZ78_01700 [Bryobacteraceae bacterium]|nr:hypothetical protein [Bryobacteraceae bacterium]